MRAPPRWCAESRVVSAIAQVDGAHGVFSAHYERGLSRQLSYRHRRSEFHPSGHRSEMCSFRLWHWEMHEALGTLWEQM